MEQAISWHFQSAVWMLHDSIFFLGKFVCKWYEEFPKKWRAIQLPDSRDNQEKID